MRIGSSRSHKSTSASTNQPQYTSLRLDFYTSYSYRQAATPAGSQALVNAMVAILKSLTMAAMVIIAEAKHFDYIANFVACHKADCHGKSYSEGNSPWKWARDGVCKTYHHHSFPGFQYKWSGDPSGLACPQCPEAFGHCTMRIFEGKRCTGRVMVEIPDVSASCRSQSYPTTY